MRPGVVPPFRVLASGVLACCLVVACTGDIARRGGEGDDGTAATGGSGGRNGGAGGHANAGHGGGGAAGMAMPPPLPAAEVGPHPLERLTRAEYDNVLGDLLGIGFRPASKFTSEVSGTSGFSTPGIVGEIEVRQFQDAAEEAARQAATKLGTLAPCDVAAVGERGCAQRFVETFGKRAYRRPLAADEVTMHLALYDALRTQALPHTEALRTLIAAMLQSPAFLYHWERGPSGAPVSATSTKVPLGPWEIASKLSFFFWQSMPDAMLFAAAEAGTLSDPAEIERQARRLLASDRADRTVERFHREWLELRNAWPKSDKYPLWTGGTDIAAVNDVIASLKHVLRQGDGTFTSMMTSRVAFVSPQLAKVYGLSEAITGTQMVTLDQAQRPGLLSRLGILALGATASEADPTRRGKLVRTRMLCQVLSAPPANIPPLPTDGTLSIRGRHEQHMNNPGCAACHKLTDGIGVGFSAYDAVGAYHPMENGTAVDDRGELVGVDGENRAFKGPAELTNLLVGSDEAKRCFARQWTQFAFDRALEDADEPSFEAIYATFANAKLDVRELLVAIATSKSFLNRAPAPEEALP